MRAGAQRSNGRAEAGLRDEAGQPIIDLLTEALTDKESWFVRGQAAYALAKLQGKGAMTLLRTVSSEDPDEVVRMLAAAAMMQVDPTLAPEPPEPVPLQPASENTRTRPTPSLPLMRLYIVPPPDVC